MRREKPGGRPGRRPGWSPSRRLGNVGRITIYDGVSGSAIRQIDGEVATEQLGESLALADVNGDGDAELLAGAWAYDPAGGAGRGTNQNNGIASWMPSARSVPIRV